jgi:Cu(I)/Ag(I) efflux system membrane fusion protein
MARRQSREQAGTTPHLTRTAPTVKLGRASQQPVGVVYSSGWKLRWTTAGDWSAMTLENQMGNAMKLLVSSVFVTMAVLNLSLAGCGAPSTDSTPTKTEPAATGEHGDHSHEDGHTHEKTGQGESSEAIQAAAELAKLAPEDRAVAEKQKVCLVGGGLLGSMGPPQKVDVSGQQVWICCEGCREMLLSNPAEYLAKLPK